MTGPAGVIGRLFTKGSVSEQIFVWAILAGVVQALGQPGLEGLRQLANLAAQNTVLTPTELADMVVRAVKDEKDAEGEAALSGIDAGRFQALVHNAGEPPGLEFLLEAFRRQFIPEGGAGPDSVSLEQGIRESRLKNKWIPVVEKMGLRPLSVSDAIDAWVEGQIPPEQAQTIAYQNGVSREDALILFHTRGRPPDPTQLIEMVNRGKIPLRGTGPDALSLQQGIFESAVKDKWEPVFEELTVRIPPPRTVVALIRAGTITDQAGARFLQDAGLSPELAAAYVAEAHHTKTQHARNLTVSTILDLYEQRVIKPEDATTLLKDLGYTDQDAGYELALRDLQREIKAVNAAVGRIGSLYVARKIEKSQAVASLNSLHIPDQQVTELLTTWDTERSLQVKVLTPAEIVAAFHWGIFDQATATQELVHQGYSEFEAWALLSIREHTALPGRPAG